jgi:hypothetical protein
MPSTARSDSTPLNSDLTLKLSRPDASAQATSCEEPRKLHHEIVALARAGCGVTSSYASSSSLSSSLLRLSCRFDSTPFFTMPENGFSSEKLCEPDLDNQNRKQQRVG